jgi:energy-coupling factor transporter ATP-binding protein EcfA2
MFRGTVLSNVCYGLRARGVPKEDRNHKARQVLKQVGLAGFDHRLAKRLSGGEIQKVALARALVIETPLFLLDEPSSALEKDFIPTFLDLIEKRADRGATVLFATHDANVIRTLADQILVFDRGRIVRHEFQNAHFVSGGLRLRVLPTSEPVTRASFPAEKVRILSPEEDCAVNNDIKVRIDTIDARRRLLSVRTNEGASLLAGIPADLDESGFRPGLDCRISINPEDIWLSR